MLCKKTPEKVGSNVPTFSGYKGFTLVELLVVISIIALLMGILMPALSRVRIQAMTVVCQSNERQMGLALQTYFIDNENTLPPSSCHADPDQYWLKILTGYTKEKLLFKCPADRSKNFFNWDSPPDDTSTWETYRWSSYATNGFFDNQTYEMYRNILKIKKLDKCIYICELQDEMDGVDHVHADYWRLTDDLTKQVAWDRHKNKSNYLFVDGHAETLQWEKTFDFEMVNLWNPKTAPNWPKRP
jgi:prepilin-type processing-associated H-X9-DG protein/prepilin-type N-terminal cleavage/methylation domain-containing protein